MSLIQQLFIKGSRAMVEAHRQQEITKVGTLRAGNTGALLENGTIVGKCARLTYLRYKGINIEGPDYSRELMFAGGRSNEDHWIEVLKASGTTLDILKEEEIPVSWMIGDIKVTGRPDIVLLEKGKPVVGIELKQASSLWTARDVGIQMKPKMMHLLQAAHYSWQLNVPFELWYTSRTDFAVMGWAQKNFPKPGEFGSDRCEYNDKGEIKKVLPFIQGYQLEWSKTNNLRWRPIDSEEAMEFPWTETSITKESIRNYYQAVLDIEVSGELPPAPVNIESTGEKGNFNICNYCPLQSICESDKSNKVQKWQASVVEYCQSNGIV